MVIGGRYRSRNPRGFLPRQPVGTRHHAPCPATPASGREKRHLPPHQSQHHLPITALTRILVAVATVFTLAPVAEASPGPTAAQSENQQSFKEGCDLLGGESFEGSYMEDGNLITYNLCLDNGPDGDGTTIYCESTRSGAVSCYSDRHGQLIIPQGSEFEGPTDTLAADPTPTPVVANARN